MCKNTGCNTCNGSCGCNCNSCCNNDCNNCNEQPCGCPFEVDFACVRYTGNELSCLDLSGGETLEQLAKRLDELLCDLSSGVDGEDGDSAYQIWLNQGNTGTEEDFLNSIAEDGNFVVTVPVNPGDANCPNGGIRIDVVDGTDGSTILSSSFVCNGQDGQDGLNAPTVYGVFTQTENSAIVTDTITPSSLIGLGEGSLQVPQNQFERGDSFRLSVHGHLSSASNQDIQIELKTGSTILASTGVVTLPNMSDERFELKVDFIIREIGVPGVASVASAGQFTYTKTASNSLEGVGFSLIENTTFDTTNLNELEIDVTWFAASTSNQIYSETLTLTKTY